MISMESFKMVQDRYLDGTTGKCLVSKDIPVQKLNRHTSSSKSSINLTLKTGSSFSLKLSRSVSFSTLLSTCSNIPWITLSRYHPCFIALLQFIHLKGHILDCNFPTLKLYKKQSQQLHHWWNLMAPKLSSPTFSLSHQQWEQSTPA